MRDDQLEAEFDSLLAIGYDLLYSRQHAGLRAIQQERLELIARKRRKRKRHLRRLRERAPQLLRAEEDEEEEEEEESSFVVCGYDAVGKGCALALRWLVLEGVHYRARR